MTFDEFYKSGRFAAGMTSILKDNAKAANVDVTGLEEQLNKIFYPDNQEFGVSSSIASASQQLAQQMKATYEEIFDNRVTKVINSLGDMSALDESSIDNRYQKFKELREVKAIVHSKSGYNSIMSSTLAKYSQNIAKIIKEITDIGSNGNILSAKLQQAQKDIKTVNEKLIDLLSDIGYTQQENPDVTNYLSNLHKKLNLDGTSPSLSPEKLEAFETAYNALLALLPSSTFSMKDIGDVFEASLQAVVSSELLTISDKTSQDLINSLFNKNLAQMGFKNKVGDLYVSEWSVGSDTTDSGKQITRGNMNNSSLRVSIPSLDGKELISYTISGDAAKRATSVRQGKVDVQYSINTDRMIKISAKNWSDFSFENKITGTMDSQDFGSTYLADALLRTVQADGRALYAMAMGDPENYHIDTYHMMANYALLLDILLGYSQGSASVNVIVINNRKQRHIYVYSIKDILDQIESNVLSIQDYEKNKNSIIGQAILLRDQVDKEDNKDRDSFHKTEAYLNQMERILKLRVALRYSDIF